MGLIEYESCVECKREKWSSDEMGKYRSRFMDLRQDIRGEGGREGSCAGPQMEKIRRQRDACSGTQILSLDAIDVRKVGDLQVSNPYFAPLRWKASRLWASGGIQIT